MSPKRFTIATIQQWVSSEAENRTFSEQTHCAQVVCDWMISLKSVTFAALFSCCMAGATWKCCRHGARCVYTIQPCISLGRVYVCLAATCHLHFWQNDRDLLRATAVTRGWNGHRNNSQHRKLTLEKIILKPLLPGLEPETFRWRVRRSTTELSPLPIVAMTTSAGCLRDSAWSHSFSRRSSSSAQDLFWRRSSAKVGHQWRTCSGVWIQFN